MPTYRYIYKCCKCGTPVQRDVKMYKNNATCFPCKREAKAKYQRTRLKLAPKPKPLTEREKKHPFWPESNKRIIDSKKK